MLLGHSKASGALPRMYWRNSVDNIALPGIHALAKEPKGAPSIPCQNAVLVKDLLTATAVP
jgi:hypothetical protein